MSFSPFLIYFILFFLFHFPQELCIGWLTRGSIFDKIEFLFRDQRLQEASSSAWILLRQSRLAHVDVASSKIKKNMKTMEKRWKENIKKNVDGRLKRYIYMKKYLQSHCNICTYIYMQDRKILISFQQILIAKKYIFPYSFCIRIFYSLSKYKDK